MKVKTPSRLHFGIIDLSRKFVREYGAIGVMIDGGFTININISEEGTRINTNKKNKKDIESVLQRLKNEVKLRNDYKIDVQEDIARHVGLGSTTQLSIGTAAGILKLEGLSYEIKELAKMVGRAKYSAIGTYGFEHGGFIMDGGKINIEEIPPLTLRSDIPENWRFIVVCLEDYMGYDETEEKPIMDELKVDAEYTERISQHIVMGILPALRTEDIVNFGFHISQIQRLVGKSFSQWQGGEFHPAVADIIEKLNQLTYGTGQSSWGPSVYGITTEEEALSARNEIESWINDHYKNAKIWVAEPENEGAKFYP